VLQPNSSTARRELANLTPDCRSATIRGNRCSVCGASITWLEARFKRTCSGLKCRAAYRTAQHESLREHDETFLQRHRRSLVRSERLRDATALAMGIGEPESYRPIVTPVNQRPIVPLSRRRRYRFVKRLVRLVEKTLQDASRAVRPLEDQLSLPIFATACANCQGKCCLRGGTAAYLDGDAIRRYAGEHPEADSRNIVESYSRRLPEAIYGRSCVFHSANGCNLPEDMRSATCLVTDCGGLVELRLRIEQDGESKFFLAATNNNGAVRGKFEDCQSLDESD
jgi:hypothetical protein